MAARAGKHFYNCFHIACVLKVFLLMTLCLIVLYFFDSSQCGGRLVWWFSKRRLDAAALELQHRWGALCSAAVSRSALPLAHRPECRS